MRALILADESFSGREQGMLTRLEVGLVAEGVRVVRAVPATALDSAPGAVYSPVVGYDVGLMGLRRSSRARALVDRVQGALESSAGAQGSKALQESLVGEAALVDVVHCFGDAAWPLGIELGLQTGAGVVLEVTSARAVARAAELAAHHGWGSEPPAVVLFAPDLAMARALEEAVGRVSVSSGGKTAGGRIALSPWGVHAPGTLPAHRRVPLDPAAPISIAVLLSDERGDHALTPVITALSEVARRCPELLVFFDAGCQRHAQVWRRSSELGLLPRISMVGDMESHREPVLHVDLLLQPGAGAEHRSLTLDAMAAGALVVAAADPLVDCLIGGTTATVITEDRRADTASWAEAIMSLIAEPDRALRQRETALAWVRDHRSGAGHVAAVLKGYEQLVGPGARAEKD
ncbi:MAG: hypothetical protein KF745_01955 [Phycisphaeraceae bacterium]|nr:hypothetical protein [Phycisphaeraceae bacterium]